ncbi:MAG: hypothetical protein AAGM67_08990, partial [Bacteroidota bacterium]
QTYEWSWEERSQFAIQFLEEDTSGNVYRTWGRGSYTAADLVDEVKNQTEQGLSTVEMYVNGAQFMIDMLQEHFPHS